MKLSNLFFIAGVFAFIIILVAAVQGIINYFWFEDIYSSKIVLGLSMLVFFINMVTCCLSSAGVCDEGEEEIYRNLLFEKKKLIICVEIHIFTLQDEEYCTDCTAVGWIEKY